MVDARDLKSLGIKYRAGSIPALGTIKIKGLTDSISVKPFFLTNRGGKSLKMPQIINSVINIAADIDNLYVYWTCL